MAGFSRADDNAAPVPGSKILVVAARFNDNIVSLLREGALAALERLGAKATLIEVPGALEIAPAIAIALDVAQKAGAPYDGVVALGCVIRGETYHFEIVANDDTDEVAFEALTSVDAADLIDGSRRDHPGGAIFG